MRHIEVTHTYVIEVPDDSPDADEQFDAVVNRGVSIMEGFMKERTPKMRELRSHWEMMPREYSRTLEARSPQAGEKSIDTSYPVVKRESDYRDPQEVRFTEDVLAQAPYQNHPWTQGLSIFPQGHPLRPFEDALREGRQPEVTEEQLLELMPADGELE